MTVTVSNEQRKNSHNSPLHKLVSRLNLILFSRTEKKLSMRSTELSADDVFIFRLILASDPDGKLLII